MKTKEFIKRVKELGFEIIREVNHIDIIFNDLIVAGTYTAQMHVMSFYCHEKSLSTNADKLLDLLVEYAKTPLDEREEEKKCFYRHKWAKTKNGNWLYMALRERPNISYLTLQGSNEDVFEYKVRFTLKEIEEIKEKYNTDLSDFEEKEVEEWK